MPLAPRDLDYFLEVARLRQLGPAAANHDVTPAALSKAIRRLEDELGLPLFDRSGGRMVLTPFGETFVQRAARIKAEHDDALRDAGEVRAGRAGLLRIGATIAVLDTVISPALAKLQPRRPGLHALLTVASSDVVLERTARGQLDASVVPAYGDALPAGLQEVTLGADALVAVAREGHPILRVRKVTLTQLAAQAWILPRAPSAARASLDAAFTRAGVQPPEGAVEVDFSSSWSLSLVRATDLLALVPLSTLAGETGKGVRVIELAQLQLPRRIKLFARADVHWSPLMQEFAEALRQGHSGGAGRRR